LLTILAQQTGTALAHAAMHDRDSSTTANLTKLNADLASLALHCVSNQIKFSFKRRPVRRR